MNAQKRFQKVNIEISNICNLQCSFCPPVERSKKLMDINLFEKIISEVAPLTDQVALHLMGDPLVHPKLQQFLDICSLRTVPVFLVTNGVLMRDHQSDLLLHSTIRQVNFSLHSFFDNHPDADPTTYLEQIFRFTETAIVKRPDLYINYRLWNLDSPQGTGAKNREMLKRIEERFDFTPNPSSDVRVQKSKRIKNRLYLHLDTEFTWPAMSLPQLGVQGTCLGLTSHFGILADGTVVPCCLDKEGDIPLGRIGDQSIVEILVSERVQNILRGFKSRKLVEDLCKRCQYIERFEQKTMNQVL
ncbi:MAG: radical SAM protein [Xanthomonadaceae bacterium]|nr:radical SAM protein [Xanthomonadaceae bacterium]